MIPQFAFEKAIKENDINTIHELLNNEEVNVAYNSNYAFKYSCENGFLNQAKLLIRHVDVNPAANNNYSFIFACRNGHIDIINLLLKEPTINPLDDNNYAFIFACEYGHLDVVKILIDIENIDTTTQNNIAFKLACENNHYNIIEFLINKQCINIETLEKEVLYTTINNSYTELFFLILPLFKELSDLEYEKCLVAAIKFNLLDIVKFLIEQDLLNKPNSSLFINSAIYSENFNIFLFLFNVDYINKELNENVFYKLTKDKETERVRFLLNNLKDYQFDFDKNVDNPIHAAIDNKDYHLAKDFLKYCLNNEIINEDWFDNFNYHQEKVVKYIINLI